ncbi:hypothetical protein K435DRAFT_870070 [Dendrothele bispora CBS 962.96]|uniref:3-isopropylmalate dehydratase n=1 Tax=Dendrothele bispora (strain CBS 962.96) TaxID=1314807 RepID=A0A4S8L7J6_DENBC|nr:hypothetical protein K435DRAFT_870070 [Dendrothele bispora CBS 962.96]
MDTHDREPTTLYDKIWSKHVVYDPDPADANTPKLIYIDRHLVHEVSSPQAFDGLWSANRSVRRPDCTLATADHNVPTSPGRFTSSFQTSEYIKEPASRAQYTALEKNVRKSGIPYFSLRDTRQGIVHVIGGEQGFILPGAVAVCGDSHTSTLGAFGALAFGIGTSEVEHVLATQTLRLRKSKNMRILIRSTHLPLGVTSKDLILHIIRTIGTAGGTGHVIEYAGDVVKSLSVEARMTMCNMSIEAGARAGLVAPDEKTVEYLRGRPFVPRVEEGWDEAVEYWKTLRSDEGAKWDKEVVIDVEEVEPTVTWGTSPEDNVPISGNVPRPGDFLNDPSKGEGVKKTLEYMGLKGGEKMVDIKIDKVFLGSCTNSRIEDLRTAAGVLLALGAEKGKVAEGMRAMVVPGSGIVKRQAEAEGLDVIFQRAGFEWREPGCSMCIGLNGDQLSSGERCASTSNRNFKDRQGTGGRTHLVSPAMAVGAAVTGRLVDVRNLVKLGKEKEKEIIKGKMGTDLPATLFDDPSPMPVDNLDEEHFSKPDDTSTATSGSGSNADSRRDSRRFTSVHGVAVPIRMENVDTDMLVPAPLLKGLGKSGFARALFNRFRFKTNPDTNKEEELDFVLNREPFRRAKIMICDGRNFGCGSSREHAVWALKDFGITCVIAPSFGDIFFNNSLQNGVLLVVLPQFTCEELATYAETGGEMEVDLVKEEIRCLGQDKVFSFKVDPNNRDRLLKGLDDIDLTLSVEEKISEYEARRKEGWRWLELVSRLDGNFKKRVIGGSMEW